MTSLPNTVDPMSGKILITSPPPNHPGFMQNIQGSLIEASASKTASSITEQASHAKALGATMRGSGRRFKIMRGGNDANIPTVPQAHSIPGVSASNVHMSLMDNLNQMKADASYDSLANATPYKVGGFRLRGEEQVATGRRKRSRKTKKHGSSKHRSNRGNRRVSRHTAKRSHRSKQR